MILLCPILMGYGNQDDLLETLQMEGLPHVERVSPTAGRPGQRVSFPGFGLGTQPGFIAIAAAGTHPAIPLTVESWDDRLIVATVPNTSATEGSIAMVIRRADGRESPFPPRLTILPAADVE